MKKSELEKQMIALGSEFKEDELSDVSIQQISDKIDLSRIEKKELQKFMVEGLASQSLYPIDEILEQYLQGNEILELSKIFPHIPTGALVYFKIKHRWPELRQKFLEDLQYSAKIKAATTKYSTISFLSTMVNTFIKKNEKGLMKYAVSGGMDDSALPARFKINDFNKLSQYLRVIASAGEINSESNEKSDDPQPTIQINTENVTVRNPDLEEASIKANDFLKGLYNRSKDEEKK
jgi:hypothetical protein